MMDWTDRHCRWFHRRLTQQALLYTEMVVADAIIHGPRDRLLGFDDVEHPVALQIGGSDPVKLAEASRIGEGFGYDEININIGCPSDRVQSGRFGACLMAEPDLVADCFASMAAAVKVPVTVKCRLGVDKQDVETSLPHFIETVSKAGCTHFIIHARKAWLKGLSTKDNRTVPPLDYELVRQMKRDFPDLEIVLNGGLASLDMGRSEAESLDGVMYGRAAYNDPWILTRVDEIFYGAPPQSVSRYEIAEDLVQYLKDREEANPYVKAMCRHITGLFAGQPGARHWRRTLSGALAAGHKPSKVVQMAAQAIRAVGEAA